MKPLIESRLSDFFKGIEGSFSFKRLQGGVMLLLFSIIVIANLFWGKMINESILDLLTFLITYTFTGITLEKFSKRGITSVAANDAAMLKEAEVAVEVKKKEIQKEENTEQ